MKINFFEIPEEGLSLTLADKSWLPRGLKAKGPVQASLYVKKLGERVIATGGFTVTVSLDCDRCLERYDKSIRSDFKIDLELATDNASLLEDADHQCRDNEMDMIYLDDAEIDVSDILQQQLYLALPMKKLCTQNCKGICPQCGANRNAEQCACQTDATSPFHVLAKLKK